MNGGWWGLVEGVRPTVSDTDGRFLMILDRSYRGVDLEVMSAGFAGTSVPLLSPGSKPHTITVPLGARVTGRLLDDGKPVAGVQVAIVQLDRNAGGHFIKAVGATTDDAGRFVFEKLPASQRYAIFSNVSSNSPTSPVLATRTFTVPADGDSATSDAPRPASDQPERTIIMPDAPRSRRETRVSLGRDPAWDLIAVPVAEDGTFSCRTPPARDLRLNVVAKGFEVDLSGLKYQPWRDVVRHADGGVDREPDHPHEAIRTDPERSPRRPRTLPPRPTATRSWPTTSGISRNPRRSPWSAGSSRTASPAPESRCPCIVRPPGRPIGTRRDHSRR